MNGLDGTNWSRTAAAAIVLLACSTAAARELKLARTAKSGVETRLAVSGHWDAKTCASLPDAIITVTVE